MTYSEFKEIVARKNLTWQHKETAKMYEVYAYDGVEKYEATIWRDCENVMGVDPAQEALNATNFEENYKDNSNYAIGQRQYAFATPDFQFKGNGVAMTVLAGETASADFKILTAGAKGLYINGGELYTKNSEVFDWIEVMVVDVDGIVAPAGTVLNDWVEKWHVSPRGDQAVVTDYAGLIPGGLYLRIVYHSTGDTAVKVAVNYKLHLGI